jgi:ParB-like chromosome segregation protein Spo0J
MPEVESTSFSPTDPLAERLIQVELGRLRPHPANANVMPEERLAKLRENIRRRGDYPPLIVRPQPNAAGAFQVLDGHQRLEVLRRLGHEVAHCYLWPCDDQTALILLSTLNRLEGQDDPLKRAELIRQLAALASTEELALLLPEDAKALDASLSLLELSLDDLLEEFQEAAKAEGKGLRALTFAVTSEDERVIEAAVAKASLGLEGQNRRGRALGLIAAAYLEEGSSP